MAVTRANLPKMLSAIQDLNDALPRVNTVGNQTEGALSSVQAAWRSPTAAPEFYRHMQQWHDDHQTLKKDLSDLFQALSDAHQDLMRKEQAFSTGS